MTSEWNQSVQREETTRCKALKAGMTLVHVKNKANVIGAE